MLWSFCVVGYWSFLYFWRNVCSCPFCNWGVFCGLIVVSSQVFEERIWGYIFLKDSYLCGWIVVDGWILKITYVGGQSNQQAEKLRGAPVGQKQRFFFFFSRNNSQAGHIGTSEECLIMQSMHSGRECGHAQEWAAEIFLNLRVCYLSRWCLGSQSSYNDSALKIHQRGIIYLGHRKIWEVYPLC